MQTNNCWLISSKGHKGTLLQIIHHFYRQKDARVILTSIKLFLQEVT